MTRTRPVPIAFPFGWSMLMVVLASALVSGAGSRQALWRLDSPLLAKSASTALRRGTDSGEARLRVVLLPTSRWPTVTVPFSPSMDWSGATYVCFRVRLEMSTPQTVGMNVLSAGKAYQRVRRMPAGRWLEYRIPIAELQAGKDAAGGWCGDSLAMGKITGVAFQGHDPTASVCLLVDEVALVTVPPASVAGFTAVGAADGVLLRWDAAPRVAAHDIFRQAAGEKSRRICRFPGTRFVDTSAKPGVVYGYQVRPVTHHGQAGELSARLEAGTDAKAPVALPSLDRFGGRADIDLGARGYFRVDRLNSRWVLVTPDGHPFYSMGVCVAGLGDSYTRVSRREELFKDILKEKDEPRFRSAWTPPYGHAAYGLDATGLAVSRYVRRQILTHGENWRQAWRDRAIKRFQDWHLNTLGAWCDGALNGAKKLPRTSFAASWGTCPKIPGVNVPDVFDPAFEQAVKGSAERVAAERDDPWLIGYFTANEMGWYGDWQNGKNLVCLIHMAEESLAAKQAWLAFLRERHRDVAALNRSWGTEFKDFAQVAADRKKLPKAAGAREDAAVFLARFAERYFKLTTAAIKQHAPHRLVLGARHSQSSSAEVLAANGRYCDVLSATLYGRSPRGELGKALAFTDKPWIVGEFHFQAKDAGLTIRNIDGTLPDQAGRGDAYQDYVCDGLGLGNLVGMHWFEYIDEPATGRFNHGKDGGEAHNIGWVDVNDRPYSDFVERAALINANVPLIFDQPLPRPRVMP